MSIVTQSKFSQSSSVQINESVPRQRLLCHCLSVSHEEVQQCISDTSAESVHEVMRGCGAGKGCTACHCRIKDLLAGLCDDCGESKRRCLCAVAVG
ncbi:MAG: (2Fe-2S)-binding protein [Planctomycetes bacterium]|nr:(2Fe-2S)-binding protein [Planctomycetota bacterium]MCH9725953.1 (2Fe-2S)-binding protein [Planctomycetota bacterium]MCH9777106.1 (2Fe-2S)-binding protein [Planctomycetota bacterium]MCH9789171.1 (2Fe-2S)-binding protein [Planctomycetota bacterium]MDF1745184.1 (2Fe-2S)-binding protein [Gimesia sp.]